MAGDQAWSPWVAVLALPDVQVELVDGLPDETGGGVLARAGSRSVVLIDRALPRVEQTAVLAHELVHLERGTSGRCRYPTRSWEAVLLREELAVDREVAARLVPIEQLARLVRRWQRIDQAVTADAVAVELDVAVRVARISLERLTVVRARNAARRVA